MMEWHDKKRADPSQVCPHVFGGMNTEQGQYLPGFSVSGMNIPGGQGMSIALGKSKSSLNYLFASQEVKETIGRLAFKLSLYELGYAFKTAENKW